MDIVFGPRQPVAPHVEVPLLCIDEHDFPREEDYNQDQEELPKALWAYPGLKDAFAHKHPHIVLDARVRHCRPPPETFYNIHRLPQFEHKFPDADTSEGPGMFNYQPVLYKGNMAILVCRSSQNEGANSQIRETFDPYRPIDSSALENRTTEHPFAEGFLRERHEGSYLIGVFTEKEDEIALEPQTDSPPPYGFDGSDFWGFPERRGWSIPLDREDLAVEAYVQPLRSRTPQAAAIFLQGWLYFGLLSEVLGYDIDLENLVTLNSSNRLVITLQGFLATKTLIKWASSHYLAKLAEPQRRLRFEELSKCLGMAKLYVKLEQEGHLDFIPFIHELALSIRILGSTLQYFVNLAFGTPTLQTSAPKSTSLDEWELFRQQRRKEVTEKSWLALPDASWGSGKILEDRLAQPPTCKTMDLPLKFIVFGEDWTGPPGYINGRCRNEIARLSNVLPPAALYFMSSLKKHRSATEHDNHAECDEISCKANNINQGAYQTMHHIVCTSERRPNCRFIGPCSTEFGRNSFEDILRRGKIPLLRIMNYDHGGLLSRDCGNAFFDVVEYDGTEPFCAISHVWSDGLGNAENNTLPTCQIPAIIRRLAQSHRPVKFYNESENFGFPEPQEIHYGSSMTMHIGEKWHWSYLADPKTAYGLFWMDTLCIPASGPLKKAMIRQMRNVYKSAAAVLVIDSSLEKINANNVHYSECFARILESAWMRRLWTFQEAVLARKLLVMFREGPLDLDNLIAGVEDQAKRLPHASFTSLQLAQGVRSMLRLSLTKDIGTIWNQGVFRTATRVGDESLCLAGMLDIDTERLFELDNIGRARYFYSRLKSIPQSMLFTNHKKLRDIGYRWADSALLRSYLKPSRDGNFTSIVNHGSNEQGRAFQIEQPGFVLWTSYTNIRFKSAIIVLCADCDGSVRLLNIQLRDKFGTFELPEDDEVGVILEEAKFTRSEKLSTTKAVFVALRPNHTEHSDSLLGTIECFGNVTEIDEDDLAGLKLYEADFFMGATRFGKHVRTPVQWLVQ